MPGRKSSHGIPDCGAGVGRLRQSLPRGQLSVLGLRNRELAGRVQEPVDDPRHLCAGFALGDLRQCHNRRGGGQSVPHDQDATPLVMRSHRAQDIGDSMFDPVMQPQFAASRDPTRSAPSWIPVHTRAVNDDVRQLICVLSVGPLHEQAKSVVPPLFVVRRIILQQLLTSHRDNACAHLDVIGQQVCLREREHVPLDPFSSGQVGVRLGRPIFGILSPQGSQAK